MNYYNVIKENLLKSEIYDRVKDYSKDRNKVNVYFETGKLLSEAGKEYGKKYNERTLRRIRQFYETFSKEKWSMMWTKLSWSHYREVLTLRDFDAIKYYLNQCETKNLTIKQLQVMIKNHEYDRLDNETKDKLVKSRQLEVTDLIPDPIIVKVNSLNENLTEYALKQSILNNLDDFLFQLGFGFTYVGSEYKIKLGDRYNYIDLLLYNIKYKCYVVIELKITELKKEHFGQIKSYMNYIDKNIKTLEENKTVGIIIVKKNNKYVIEYCSDERIIAKVYELI